MNQNHYFGVTGVICAAILGIMFLGLYQAGVQGRANNAAITTGEVARDTIWGEVQE